MTDGSFAHPLTLLKLDIDHFKRINDNHGHGEGDQALRDFARICRGQLGKIDRFGRVGGDELNGRPAGERSGRRAVPGGSAGGLGGGAGRRSSGGARGNRPGGWGHPAGGRGPGRPHEPARREAPGGEGPGPQSPSLPDRGLIPVHPRVGAQRGRPRSVARRGPGLRRKFPGSRRAGVAMHSALVSGPAVPRRRRTGAAEPKSRGPDRLPPDPPGSTSGCKTDRVPGKYRRPK